MSYDRECTSRKRIHLTLLLSIAIALLSLLKVDGTIQMFAAKPESPLPAGSPPVVAKTSKPSATTLLTYDSLPLLFEPNVGQSSGEVKFLSRTPDHVIYLLNDGAAITVRRKRTTGLFRGTTLSIGSRKGGVISATVRLRLSNVSKDVKLQGEGEQPSRSNYFIGDDPARWQTDVINYSTVHYFNAYPGIDLIYYGYRGKPKYDFIVAPNSDPQQIKFRYEGARSVRIGIGGDLIIETDIGRIYQSKPVIYQEIDGEKRFIKGTYVRTNKDVIGLSIQSYNRNVPLVIDPTISYSTYLGGSGRDEAFGIVADNSGNAYITGETQSTDFPVTAGAYSTSPYGDLDVFISKLNPSGTGLVYSTYIGGKTSIYGNGKNADDVGYSIAVDSSGRAYVAGATSSTDFPTTPNAYQPPKPGGGLFLVRLSSAGNSLDYSTRFHGRGAFSIAAENTGIAYVTGMAGAEFPGGITSRTPPVANIPSTTKSFKAIKEQGSSDSDAFLAKIDTTATGDAGLLYATFIGGTGHDQGQGVAIDSAGGACITGYTESSDFPTSANSFQSRLIGGRDAFVVKLNTMVSGSSSLVYASYFGHEDAGLAVSVDSANKVYVTGYTGNDFPVTANGFQRTLGGVGSDAFLAQFDPSATTGTTSLIYATYLGGKGNDRSNSIAVDSLGSVLIVGTTEANDFPVTGNAFQQAPGGHGYTETSSGPFKSDAFLTKLNPRVSGQGGLSYSTYIGGDSNDLGMSIALDSSGNAYISGTTFSGDFPVTPGVLQPTLKVTNSRQSSSDSFIIKFFFPTAADADVAVSLSGSASQVSAGGQFTYTAKMINNGPDQASELVFYSRLPVGTTFQAIDIPAGWSCRTPQVGGTGPVVCKTSSLSVGTEATLAVRVTINCSVSSSSITNSVSVYGNARDSNETNNTASLPVGITASANVLTCPTGIHEKANAVINGKSGRIITFAPTSTCPGVSVSCYPKSGHFFLVGTTNVACFASDSTGTVATCVFKVQIDP